MMGIGLTERQATHNGMQMFFMGVNVTLVGRGWIAQKGCACLGQIQDKLPKGMRLSLLFVAAILYVVVDLNYDFSELLSDHGFIRRQDHLKLRMR